MITGPAFPTRCCHQQAHPVQLSCTGEIVSCVCVECWEPLPADYIARQLAHCLRAAFCAHGNIITVHAVGTPDLAFCSECGGDQPPPG